MQDSWQQVQNTNQSKFHNFPNIKELGDYSLFT